MRQLGECHSVQVQVRMERAQTGGNEIFLWYNFPGNVQRVIWRGFRHDGSDSKESDCSVGDPIFIPGSG